MPKNLSPTEVKAILESGNFDELIGAVEDEKLECKGKPYQTKKDHQKQELAKDVAGLANAGGGIILIGVRTVRDPTHFGDEIKDVRSFEQKLINSNQYQDILNKWIYPSLQQVEIRWFRSSRNRKKGVVSIFIPIQPPGQQPFLITRTIDDTGKLGEVVFGYAERKRANVIPKSVQEIHALLRDGRRLDEISRQYATLQEMLGQLQQEIRVGKEKPSESDAFKQMGHRMNEARDEARLHDDPVFILAASPVDVVEIQDIFRGDSEIVRLIDKPPELRYAGFDLDTGASSEIVRGKLRRAGNPGKILEVWRDGTLIFAARGNSDFLSWGRRTTGDSALYINPLVLIESTYLFAELSRQIFSKVTPGPKEIEYKLDLRKMTVRGKPCILIPGPVGSITWQFGEEEYKATASNVVFPFRWADPEIKAGEIAYGLVREVYRWFSINDNEIPYTDRIEGRVIISADKIQKVRQ